MVLPPAHHGEKDNQKQAAVQIKILAAPKESPDNYYSNASAKDPQKKKARNGVLTARKQQGKKNPKYKGYQRYCVLYKKYGIPECKFK